MAKQVVNNGDLGSSARAKINDNFTELYDQDVDVPAVALTDGATIDITGPKHTLSTALGRTFTISHGGDNGVIDVTLNAASATFTFPSGWKCISEGQASGTNSMALSGTSGDVYNWVWYKVGSLYRIASKNLYR